MFVYKIDISWSETDNSAWIFFSCFYTQENSAPPNTNKNISSANILTQKQKRKTILIACANEPLNSEEKNAHTFTVHTHILTLNTEKKQAVGRSKANQQTHWEKNHTSLASVKKNAKWLFSFELGENSVCNFSCVY